MANYALIKPVGELEVVDNIIVADAEFAATELVANGGVYDYALDISLYSPTPEMGYIYDPGEDSFSAPADPEDYATELEAAVYQLHVILMRCLDLASNLNASQVENKVDQGIADAEEEFTANEADLMSDIADFINNGG